MSFITSAQAGIDLMLSRLGESQSWTPAAGGAATPFTGIFDNDYLDVNVVVEVASAKPAMIVKTTSVAGIARGDTVTVTSTLYGISGVAYTLVTKEDSPADLGPGMSRLVLKL